MVNIEKIHLIIDYDSLKYYKKCIKPDITEINLYYL
jgi:hypothetical protein